MLRYVLPITIMMIMAVSDSVTEEAKPSPDEVMKALDRLATSAKTAEIKEAAAHLKKEYEWAIDPVRGAGDENKSAISEPLAFEAFAEQVRSQADSCVFACWDDYVGCKQMLPPEEHVGCWMTVPVCFAEALLETPCHTSNLD